jgi:hypothetical protein
MDRQPKFARLMPEAQGTFLHIDGVFIAPMAGIDQ